eukprot:7143885-Pyramimonas_sp.AAC.1
MAHLKLSSETLRTTSPILKPRSRSAGSARIMPSDAALNCTRPREPAEEAVPLLTSSVSVFFQGPSD